MSKGQTGATFVLVHGAMHGGWCWGPVSGLLREQGHLVFSPTLTGQGDRHHVLTPETSVDTHIQDIVNTVIFEDLRDVHFVFHSYSGGLIGPVVNAIPDRVASITAAGAFLLRSGECNFDVQPPESRKLFEDLASEDGWSIPPGPRLLERWGITDPELAAYVTPRLTRFSLNFSKGIVTFDEAIVRQCPRTYIEHTNPPLPPLEISIQRARDDDWRMLRIDTGHDMMLTEPEAMTQLILQAAATS